MSDAESTTLFGSEDGVCSRLDLDGCTSATFDVTDQPVVVRAFNLLDDEKIFVEMVAGDNEGEFFERMRNGCGCSVALTACNNSIVLPASGRYRLNRCACPDENGDPVTAPANNLAHVEYQRITTGAAVSYGDVSMTCGCDTGSDVSVAQAPDGTTVVTVDGVSTIIQPGTTVSAADLGDSILLTVDGVPHTIDKGPDTPAEVAALLGLVDCSGAPVSPGAAVATCADLEGALAQAIAADKDYVDGAGDPVPDGACLTTCADLEGALAQALAADKDYVDGAGDPVPDGACLTTCADLAAALAALPADVYAVSGVMSGGNVVFTMSDGTMFSVAIDPAEIAAALGFEDCTGAAVPAGTAMATCADLNAALSSLTDVYVNGLSSYNATTNTLTLSMSDGSTVALDMTDLLADAVSATDNGDGTITLVIGGVSYCVAECGAGGTVTERRTASVAVNTAANLHTIPSATQANTTPTAVLNFTLPSQQVVDLSFDTRVEFAPWGVAGRQLQGSWLFHDEVTGTNLLPALGWRDYVDTTTIDGNTHSGTFYVTLPAGPHAIRVDLFMQTNNLDAASIVTQSGQSIRAAWLEEV